MNTGESTAEATIQTTGPSNAKHMLTNRYGIRKACTAKQNFHSPIVQITKRLRLRKGIERISRTISGSSRRVSSMKSVWITVTITEPGQAIFYFKITRKPGFACIVLLSRDQTPKSVSTHSFSLLRHFTQSTRQPSVFFRATNRNCRTRFSLKSTYARFGVSNSTLSTFRFVMS